MQQLTTCLWFDGDAEEAATFYSSLFPASKLGGVTRYPSDIEGNKAGQVMTVDFELNGQKFVSLNGGPDFKFSEAISFQVPCEDQAEIDRYWNAFVGGGGEESVCGWCRDRFGLSWQIIPKDMPRWMAEPGSAKRVTDAFLKMKKLDYATLEAAAAGRRAA